jgi:hypothetical protein
MNTKFAKLLCVILALILTNLACGISPSATPKANTEAPVISAVTEIPAKPAVTEIPAKPAITEIPASSENTANTETDQWASSASASSEYGVSGWIATQATGAPDTTACGDNPSAWASSSTNTVEWIQLGYTTPVYVTQVVIYITYNPSYITKVELVDTNGGYHTAYTAQPKQMDCPTKMIISFPRTSYLVSGVKITVDQTTLNSWSEIDAVQLTGTLK